LNAGTVGSSGWDIVGSVGICVLFLLVSVSPKSVMRKEVMILLF
jgi:hypothetical protein